MSFFSKLKFWKKDDDLLGGGLDNFLSSNDSVTGSSTSSSSSNSGLGLGQSLGQSQGLNQNNQGLGFSNASSSTGAGFNTNSFEAFNPQPFSQSNAMQSSSNAFGVQSSQQREFELILAKLDAIRAELQLMNQRIAMLEKAANIEEKHYW